jgi:hypothetical protein
VVAEKVLLGLEIVKRIQILHKAGTVEKQNQCSTSEIASKLKNSLSELLETNGSV